jgi:hypothetical protein
MRRTTSTIAHDYDDDNMPWTHVPVYIIELTRDKTRFPRKMFFQYRILEQYRNSVLLTGLDNEISGTAFQDIIRRSVNIAVFH